MEKSRELLEKALKIGRSNGDALKEWYTELTVEEQAELAVQFHDVLDDLIPTIHAIMDQIKVFVNCVIERWSEIAKMLEEP